MIQTGTKAPNFTLQDALGNSISLSDFSGKKVVLYFYPKDNTPGCTKQACAFRDAYEDFKKKDVIVIGISKDSVRSHANFAKKYELPFILLADPEKEVLQTYQVLKLKKMYGKEVLGTVRTTYIIDENGIIIDAQEKVTPADNAKEVLEKLS